MSERERLESLRRLAELRAREAASPAPTKGEYKPSFRFGNELGIAATEMGNKVTDTLAGILPNERTKPEHYLVPTAQDAGFVANVGVNLLPTLLFGGLASPKNISATEPLAHKIMQTAVKPAADDVLSGAYKRAAGTIFREGIQPTSGGMVKTMRNVSEIHPQVEALVAKSSAEVPMANVGQKYLAQYNKALEATDPGDLAAVTQAWKQLQAHPGVGTSEGPITAQMAHLIKRGIQQSVGSKNYGEMGSMSTEANKALAKYLREGVSEAIPKTVVPLKRESDLMNLLEVVQRRAAQAGNANPAGLAALRMDDPRSFAAFMADRSNILKGLAAHLTYQMGRPQYAVPAATTAAQVPELFSRE